MIAISNWNAKISDVIRTCVALAVWCYERLASAQHYAYDVIEIRVPNKKNFKFGLWASYKPNPVP